MIELSMKRDGRTFDHQTLEAIRMMAVERVREGEHPADVIASYRFNRTTMYKWLNAIDDGGDEALRSTQATRHPSSLTAEQEQQVFRWVNGKDPRQYGLDFGLWTRASVAELIAQKFGIKLGLTAVGKQLAKLGLTPQKPLQRAYQRNPEAIEQWRHEHYRAIARQAKEPTLRVALSSALSTQKNPGPGTIPRPRINRSQRPSGLALWRRAGQAGLPDLVSISMRYPCLMLHDIRD